jgi:hypothetical protein
MIQAYEGGDQEMYQVDITNNIPLKHGLPPGQYDSAVFPTVKECKQYAEEIAKALPAIIKDYDNSKKVRHLNETRKCPKCKGTMLYVPECGSFVCENNSCGHHQSSSGQDFARCYCGWSASGGNGRQELEEMGEQIDENY